MARTRSSLVPLVVLGITLVACSPSPAPVAQAANDPSNPDAPEGAPMTPTTGPEAPASTAPAHHGHHHDHASSGAAPHAGHSDAAAADVVYVCPMHPEVTSKAPGICPKCNMKLVPRK